MFGDYTRRPSKYSGSDVDFILKCATYFGQWPANIKHPSVSQRPATPAEKIEPDGNVMKKQTISHL